MGYKGVGLEGGSLGGRECVRLFHRCTLASFLKKTQVHAFVVDGKRSARNRFALGCLVGYKLVVLVVVGGPFEPLLKSFDLISNKLF